MTANRDSVNRHTERQRDEERARKREVREGNIRSLKRPPSYGFQVGQAGNPGFVIGFMLISDEICATLLAAVFCCCCCCCHCCCCCYCCCCCQLTAASCLNCFVCVIKWWHFWLQSVLFFLSLPVEAAQCGSVAVWHSLQSCRTTFNCGPSGRYRVANCTQHNLLLDFHKLLPDLRLL